MDHGENKIKVGGETQFYQKTIILTDARLTLFSLLNFINLFQLKQQFIHNSENNQVGHDIC